MLKLCCILWLCRSQLKEKRRRMYPRYDRRWHTYTNWRESTRRQWVLGIGDYHYIFTLDFAVRFRYILWSHFESFVFRSTSIPSLILIVTAYDLGQNVHNARYSFGLKPELFSARTYIGHSYTTAAWNLFQIFLPWYIYARARVQQFIIFSRNICLFLATTTNDVSCWLG